MRIKALDKSKHFFFYSLKYLVPALALASIVWQLNLMQVETQDVLDTIKRSVNGSIGELLLIVIGFTSLNWLVEAFKWQRSVSSVKHISLLTSLKQCLSGTTASILTPAKLGDYAAKPMFFETEIRWQIVSLNAACHVFQMLTTTVFGGISLILLLNDSPELFSQLNIPDLAVIITSISVVLLMLWAILKLKMKQRYKALKDLLQPLNTLLCAELFGLSILRFLIFSLQFILLLQFMGSELDVLWSFVISSVVYLLNSMLPTPAVSDGLIRSGLGLFLFGLYGVDGWIVLNATLLMWLANHVLPAALGSYSLFKLKPKHLS